MHLFAVIFVLVGSALVAGQAVAGDERTANEAETKLHREAQPGIARRGMVRVEGHSLVDDEGPFLGLGVSYFTALGRFRTDRARLESDLEFLSNCGFNYYRMLSMVGWYEAWEGREIAPVSFTNRRGGQVAAWPDYWRQFAELVDLAYDRYGLRTQITVFADAQLMPEKRARIKHMERLIADVVRGREEKIMLIEVANEAWQNGFEGEAGIAELREFTKFLTERTEVPVAITSNHHDEFVKLYRGSSADLATWHFSRDRRTDEGWKPVYDCWDFGMVDACPPAVSNEPIGPGASVTSEEDPLRLVLAAPFAYVAKLPAYLFHCEAGVFGKSRFEETVAIERVGPLVKLLPGDLANWDRFDGREAGSPFTIFARGEANKYRSEVAGSRDGCVRFAVARRGDEFVGVVLGVGEEGLRLVAREGIEVKVYDPLTCEVEMVAECQRGDELLLGQGLGGWIMMGRIRDGAKSIAR